MALQPAQRRRAGHYEILGETLAKFEFFQAGWNPYSRFLDVEKVDLILRRSVDGVAIYREIQVKFGKLYPVGPAWMRALFDVTSWRFFKPDEFANASPTLYVAYVLSEDEGYQGDIFVFPVCDFASLIEAAPLVGKNPKHRVYLSRCVADRDRWVLQRSAKRFDDVTDETCLDVSSYRRNFEILERSEAAG